MLHNIFFMLHINKSKGVGILLPHILHVHAYICKVKVSEQESCINYKHNCTYGTTFVKSMITISRMYRGK